jgi:hypothetical protein
MPEPGERNLADFFQTPVEALPLDVRNGRCASFQIKAKALDFVRKGLKSAALVRSGVGPVFLKLDNRLEAEGGSGDLRLEDPDEVGGGGFCEVDNNWL